MKKPSNEQVVLVEEADAWFERNFQTIQNKNLANDPVISTIAELKLLSLPQQQVLEIGCANGYKLDYLQQHYQAHCMGLEPSQKAIENAAQQYPNLEIKHGTAEQLPFQDNQFDLVIIGFCLYLCSREKLFQIAYQIDRVLKPNSRLIIHDFFAVNPDSNDYQHHQQITCHKMNYSRLFCWHPHYQEIFRRIEPYQPADQACAVQVIAHIAS